MIPRPPGVRAGGGPPWASADPRLLRGITLERVRLGLPYEDRPDGEGPYGEVPYSGATAEGHVVPTTGAPSAVLVALFEEDGEARVVLTRRSARLRRHRGEVSFPGGRQDDGESPVAAALREASEEVGMDAASVEVLGTLSPLSTFSSGSFITPVVGVLPGRPLLVANPAEVERVFDVALAELLAAGVFREEMWTLRGASADAPGVAVPGGFPVWFFELRGDTVWGATARVLVELLSLVVGGTRT
ncbi:MAG: CoA pyrophosphatase [Actinobacteria bacterium]|nr:CoA pyrophosphatase [Actinomycetota bacterium]